MKVFVFLLFDVSFRRSKNANIKTGDFSNRINIHTNAVCHSWSKTSNGFHKPLWKNGWRTKLLISNEKNFDQNHFQEQRRFFYRVKSAPMHIYIYIYIYIYICIYVYMYILLVRSHQFMLILAIHICWRAMPTHLDELSLRMTEFDKLWIAK